MAEEKPIIVIKKKGGHGGHHGGAWKVAYADFVTAMMAFFMVMWLINSAESPTKKSIAAYFRRAGIFEKGSGSPLQIGGAGILTDGYVPPHPEDIDYRSGSHKEPLPGKGGTDDDKLTRRITLGGGEGLGLVESYAETAGLFIDRPDNIGQIAYLERNEQTGIGNATLDNPLAGEVRDAAEAAYVEAREAAKEALEGVAQEIRQQIEGSEELQELLGIVDVTVGADGLNIEILDTERSSMFTLGSARVLPEARQAFAKLAEIIKPLPNKVDIVGHTDAKPFSSRRGGYSNWELSADRANAARRILESEGISPDRVTSVVGRGDRELKVEDDPFAAANRRITLKLRLDFSSASALKELDQLSEFTTQEEINSAKRQQSQPARPKEQEKVHTLTAEEVLDPSKRKKNRVLLPEAGPRTNENPNYMERDKIFGDNPVIGSNDPFAHL